MIPCYSAFLSQYNSSPTRVSSHPAVPPGGTGEFISIDPVTQQVIARLQLPTTCGTPHGMNIDMQEQIAFIACTDVD